MAVRDRMYELTTPEEVDAFFKKYPTCVFFKAGSCHKTTHGFGFVESALKGRKDLHLGVVRVIENRPASNYITEITGITHQSPQFILMKEGAPVFDLDNWDITLEALGLGLNQHHGVVEHEEETAHKGDISPYVTLLEEFVGGQISEKEFELRWLETFRVDSSLRSAEEFNLLNRLYGDVDEMIVHACSTDLTVGDTSLFERAEALLNELRSRHLPA
ncbi:MAG: monothiol bacilliredoxin BrxC family protein [Waddliaceae bacterium]